MSFVKSVALPSGAQIPTIALGVYMTKPGSEAYDAVLAALKLGYRHIDSATFYENEADVGRAVRDSGIPRNEIFVTSKYHAPEWSYDTVVKAVKDSLQRFGFTYLDLYLLHAPRAPENRSEAWRALEDMQSQGLVRDIGVSNFGIPHLKKLEKTWRVKPAVNQFEVHPFCARTELVQYCQANGMVVEAYAPLTRAEKLNDPKVVKIAKEANATSAQALLAWGLSKGFVVLPKSVHEARIQENINAAKVTLTPKQIAEFDTMNENFATCWDPIKNDAV
jgi:diketogulonate reductase-like aldo/keto reductase